MEPVDEAADVPGVIDRVSRILEDERGIEFAARQQVGYACARGHEFEITMSVEADIPGTWECRCGKLGKLVDGPEPEIKPAKHVRTHWDMLLERRSIPELEELLEERLALLRAKRGEKPRKRSA